MNSNEASIIPFVKYVAAPWPLGQQGLLTNMDSTDFQ